jgi:hypothetical protein
VDCHARGALTGFVVGDGSRAERCTATAAGGSGFVMSFRVSASGCTSRGNGEDGFYAGDECSFTDCHAASNSAGTGFHLVGESCSAANCSSTGNSYGFSVGPRGTATGCRASSNSAVGFYVQVFSMIDACHASDNPTAFWMWGSRSRITNSTASAPGGTGIDVFGNAVIVRHNAIVQSDTGIHLDNNFFCTVISNHINDSANEIDDDGTANNVAALVSIADTAGPHANFVE